MKRRVLISIAIATGYCLSPFTSGGLTTSYQQASTVLINWQIRLNDTTNFDFTRLAVSLQSRPGKPHAWTTLGSFTPDKTGRFVTSVPAGSWLSVDVSTSDPTVKLSTDFEFYALEQNSTETIMQQEFYVPTDSDHVDRGLELRRGSAFTVCVPGGLKSGSIQFYKESEAHQRKISVITFIDEKTVFRSLIGGLRDGKWRVMYVGDNDVIFRSDEVDLKQGQILRQKCGK